MSEKNRGTDEKLVAEVKSGPVAKEEKTESTAVVPYYKWEKTMGEDGQTQLKCVPSGGKTVYSRLKVEQKLAILHIQAQVEDKLISIKRNIYEIGKLLSEAKAILPHGQFKPWIQETFGRHLPYSSAACYKAIYERFKGAVDHPEFFQRLYELPLSFLQTLKQDSFPDTLLAIILENREALAQTEFELMTQAHRDYKDGILPLAEFEELIKELIKRAYTMFYSQSTIRTQIIKKRAVKIGLSAGPPACFYPCIGFDISAEKKEAEPAPEPSKEAEPPLKKEKSDYSKLNEPDIKPAGTTHFGVGFFPPAKANYNEGKSLTFFFYDGHFDDYDFVLQHLQEKGIKFKRHPYMDSKRLVELLKLGLEAEKGQVKGELAANI
jgi:hypothetical protein